MHVRAAVCTLSATARITRAERWAEMESPNPNREKILIECEWKGIGENWKRQASPLHNNGLRGCFFF